MIIISISNMYSIFFYRRYNNWLRSVDVDKQFVLIFTNQKVNAKKKKKKKKKERNEKEIQDRRWWWRAKLEDDSCLLQKY